jgi:uncharacterized protein YaaW (UPF0174 family)
MPRNEKNSGDMPGDNGTSKDFAELLQLYQKIPEAGRKKLKERVKKEAAGDILTDEMIEKEKKSLRRFFSKIDDPRKKNLIFRKIDEIAFQYVAMSQAKEAMITEGLNSKVINGKQSYDKENPAVAIYDKYSRAYNTNIDKLIEYLPPQEKKKISRLAALREG